MKLFGYEQIDDDSFQKAADWWVVIVLLEDVQNSGWFAGLLYLLLPGSDRQSHLISVLRFVSLPYYIHDSDDF